MQLCQCHLKLQMARRSSPFCLGYFLRQFFLIMLQRMQTFSILNWMIMVSLTSSQISPFHNTPPPIAMANILQVVDVKMERF